jgi:hypothetical protein
MNFKIGDTVKYEFMDGEEGRSYGWFRNTAQAKIVSVYYKLDNGKVISESDLTLVPPKEYPKESTESKSDPPKQQ